MTITSIILFAIGLFFSIGMAITLLQSIAKSILVAKAGGIRVPGSAVTTEFYGAIIAWTAFYAVRMYS